MISGVSPSNRLDVLFIYIGKVCFVQTTAIGKDVIYYSYSINIKLPYKENMGFVYMKNALK